MSWIRTRLSSVCTDLFGDRWWLFTFCFARNRPPSAYRSADDAEEIVVRCDDDDKQNGDVTVVDVTDTDSGVANSTHGIDSISTTGSLSPDTNNTSESILSALPSTEDVCVVPSHASHAGRPNGFLPSSREDLLTMFENGKCHVAPTTLMDGVHSLLSQVYYVNTAEFDGAAVHFSCDSDVTSDGYHRRHDNNCNSVYLQNHKENDESVNAALELNRLSLVPEDRTTTVNVNNSLSGDGVTEPVNTIHHSSCHPQYITADVEDEICVVADKTDLHVHQCRNSSELTDIADCFNELQLTVTKSVGVQISQVTADEVVNDVCCLVENVSTLTDPEQLQIDDYVSNEQRLPENHSNSVNPATAETSRELREPVDKTTSKLAVAVIEEVQLHDKDEQQETKVREAALANDVASRAADTVDIHLDDNDTTASEISECDEVRPPDESTMMSSIQDHTYVLDHVTERQRREGSGPGEWRSPDASSDLSPVEVNETERGADEQVYDGQSMKSAQEKFSESVIQVDIVPADDDCNVSVAALNATCDQELSDDILNNDNNHETVDFSVVGHNLVSTGVMSAWKRHIEIEDQELFHDFDVPPTSPTNANFLDNFSDVSFDTDDWFDDFDATAANVETSVHRDIMKSPPPYNVVSDSKAAEIALVTSHPLACSTLPIDMSMTLPDIPPFSVVPTTEEDVTPIINSALDVCWQCRRYGEPLDSVLPPPSFFTQDELLDTLDGTSCRCFKRLIFDLVAEVLHDICYEEEPTELAPWSGPPLIRPRRFPVSSDQTPTTVDAVRPVVHYHVLRCLGMTSDGRTLAKSKKWLLGRKINTIVDHMLVEELCLEEPEWVHYDEDVTTRKLQIADFLMDALIYDASQAIISIERRRHEQNSPALPLS